MEKVSKVRKAKTTSVSFSYSTEKTIQAAAVLLRKYKNWRMPYMRLLKLLYIADRESLRETGRPIAGSTPVAMKYGLLDGRVLDLIKGSIKDPLWSKFIRRKGYYVTLLDDPRDLKLSEYEVAKLEEVADKYRKMDRFELAALTHEFEEYKDPKGGFLPVPLEDIIDAVGRTADKEEIIADAREKAYADQVFGR